METQLNFFSTVFNSLHQKEYVFKADKTKLEKPIESTSVEVSESLMPIICGSEYINDDESNFSTVSDLKTVKSAIIALISDENTIFLKKRNQRRFALKMRLKPLFVVYIDNDCFR